MQAAKVDFIDGSVVMNKPFSPVIQALGDRPAAREVARNSDVHYEFRQDSDFAMAELSGLYQINFSLSAGESGGVANPEYLSELDAFANW